MRAGREGWILGALLGLFVLGTAWLTQRGEENQRREQPTTYSTGRGGTRALFDLLDRQGVAVVRFERPYTRIPADAGLLIMFEPIARNDGNLEEGENAALWKWVENGGSFLLVTSPQGMGKGVELNSVGVSLEKSQPADLPVNSEVSPLLRDVGKLLVEGPLRLQNLDPKKQTTLVADAEGAYAVTFPRKKGRVTVVTEGLAASNAQLAKADNAIFFVNVAQAAAGPSSAKTVLFDEYHQGFGSESVGGNSLWQAMGAPLRNAFWYLGAVALILIYSLNRRFGAPIVIEGPRSRPSTEYIASMAGFYRRAQAADIPFENIYRAFLRDLAARVDAPPDASAETLATLASRRYGWSQDTLRALLDRSRAVIEQPAVAAGSRRAAARAHEREVFSLARQIQEFRRKAELVRLA
jgi:hypothetical protein